MEEKFISAISLIFSYWGLYLFISLVLFFYTTIKEVREILGGKYVYETINNNWMKFHVWGKDKTILKSIEKINILVQNITKICVIGLLISLLFPFFNFLTSLFILIILTSIWFLYSYKWVLNHTEEVKNTFLSFVKILIFSVLVSLLLYLFFIYTADLEYVRELGITLPENLKTALYFKTIVFSIVFLLFMILFSYLGFWAFFGILPISLILSLFFLLKLSKYNKFLESKILKIIIILNMFFLTFITLLFFNIN